MENVYLKSITDEPVFCKPLSESDDFCNLAHTGQKVIVRSANKKNDFLYIVKSVDLLCIYQLLLYLRKLIVYFPANIDTISDYTDIGVIKDRCIFSELTAMIVLAETPTICCNAPATPNAIYSFGVTEIPV